MRVFQTGMLLLILFSTTLLWAHGGGHAPAHEPAEQQNHSQHMDMDHSSSEEEPVTYGIEEDIGEDGGENSGESTYGFEPDTGMSDHSSHGETSSSEPGLFEDPLIEIEAAPTPSQHDGSHSTGSHEQHVEPTSFEKVDSDASGRGVAIGLTVFAGLTFGFLSLIRPFE